MLYEPCSAGCEDACTDRSRRWGEVLLLLSSLMLKEGLPVVSSCLLGERNFLYVVCEESCCLLLIHTFLHRVDIVTTQFFPAAFEALRPTLV